MPVSRDTAAWAMRFLLDQEPDGDTMIDFHRNGYDTMADIRTAFLQTPEARTLFRRANGANYTIPTFLLRRPAFPNVPWRFGEPTLDDPISQLCTSEQMGNATYEGLCRRLGLDPASRHRKVWEFAYILAVLERKGSLRPGCRGLGFGTGREPLPAALAAAGVSVVATDAPPELDVSESWAQSAQWARGLEDLWRPDLVDRDAFMTRVTFRPADMNHIPPDLRNFDFCWSACCLEHLGSIRQGLDYLHRCLDTLKPGGVSVQTTEFNLLSDEDTLETSDLCLFRKRDIEVVIDELVRDGHRVEPLNLWPGAQPVDEHLDLPPSSGTHLKLRLGDYLTTSIGLVVTKKGGPSTPGGEARDR